MFSKSITAIVLLAIGTLTVMKLPRWISKPLMLVPSWLQALVLHFGYGTWIGGVTGHLVAGLMSIPWFFVSEFFLRPRILNIMRPQWSKVFAHPHKQ